MQWVLILCTYESHQHIVIAPFLIFCLTDTCSMIAGITNDEQCASRVSCLVQDLPEHHKSTLHFLMVHFCLICHLQYAHGMTEPPTHIIDFLCHAFLRPPWDKAA